MGAGRRTHTFTLPEKSKHTPSVNCSITARNLKWNELGGVIFGCKHRTKKECLAKKLFGLPAPHFSYVRNVKPGLPLFLFNYSDRKLHGIFEAASPGKLNIDPHGWTEDGSDTPYAAQVKMQIKVQCQPLIEDQFGPIISENYYDSGLFWFELDHEQTSKLISLLSSSQITAGNRHYRMTETTSGLSRASSASNARKESSTVMENASGLDVAHPVHTKMVGFSDASASCMDSKNMETVTQNSIQVVSHVKRSSGIPYSSVVKNMCSFKNGSQHAPHLEEETGKQDVVHLKPNDNQSCSSSVGGNNTSLPQKKWSSLFGTETTTSAGRKFEILKMPVSEAPVAYSDCKSTRWDSNIPQTGKEIQVDPKALVAAVQCEEKLINSELNYQLVDSSIAPTMRTSLQPVTIGGMAGQVIGHVGEEALEINSAFSDEAYLKLIQSFVQPYLNGQSESSGSPRAEHAVQYSGSDTLCSEGISYPGTKMFYPMGSFDSQSVAAKLVQEVEELKFSKLQYIHKINSLELDLAKSRQEFQQLNDQFKLLKMGHTAEAGSQSNFPCHSNMDEWMFIVGGYNGNSWLMDLDLFSSSKDLLKSLCPMSAVCSYSSAAMLNGELYVFGGASGHTWYDTVKSYNPSTNQWVNRPGLNQKKGSLAGVSLNEKIFAIGGGNGVECFSEVEVFDQHFGKWIQSRPMLHKRFSAAAANFDGVIYVAGGYDGNDYLKSMERFDPRERTWVELGSMSMKRACHSVAVLDKRLYGLGGYDGSKMVPTVEVYDPCMNKWMMGEPMKNRRGYFSSVVIKNAIYAIGGLSGNSEVLDEVECYKDGLGWQVTDLKSIGKRAFFSAVML